MKWQQNYIPSFILVLLYYLSHFHPLMHVCSVLYNDSCIIVWVASGFTSDHTQIDVAQCCWRAHCMGAQR